MSGSDVSLAVRIFGGLLIACENCGAAPGETCRPPEFFDCACPTCAGIVASIEARESEGCPGRRIMAGAIYEQDPDIDAVELLRLATRAHDRRMERFEAEYQKRKAQQEKAAATRARNASAANDAQRRRMN